MENKVTVKDNAVAYPSNPEFGYVVLTSEEIVEQNGWAKLKERSTLMRGEMKLLTRMYTKGKALVGKIAVVECTEDNIPASVIGQLNKNVGFEEQIASFLKRAGSQDAPVLMSGGKRILRFTIYDATGNVADIRVQHDNTDAVKAFNSAKSASANLPS